MSLSGKELEMNREKEEKRKFQEGRKTTPADK